jgi:uncharacterized protein YqhQ
MDKQQTTQPSFNPERFSYGGQAVIEGVMMRGAHKAAIAVRAPNREIHIKEIDLNAALYRGRIARTPFLRGLVGLWDALGLGTQALLWSADVALIEGSYYQVEHQGQAAWVHHIPSAMQVEGDLNSVPTLKSSKDELSDLPATLPQLHIQAKRAVKLLAKPEFDAKAVAEIHEGRLPIRAFFPAESKGDVFTGAGATVLVLFSLAMGIGLFFVLPTLASSAAGEWAGVGSAGTNLIEEVFKLVLFLGYLFLIGQMEDVKRLFRYHGAEHKTINAYEAEAELTPATVQTYPIEHPRCGTAFLLNVIIISMILNTLIGRFDNNLLLLIPARVITVPIVAGIAYEWLRWTAKNVENPLVSWLIKPNLLLQRLTTREPDEEMAEVAIKALERVLAAEGLAKTTPASSH